MSDCYTLKEVVGPPGSFDSIIDCTYVLIMEGSKREGQITEHVMKAGLTSNVLFQYNKGYKKCKKNLRVQKTNYDLEHALKNVFRHALKSGYERILVLEDDCEFDERIRDPEVIHDVGTFLVEKNPSVYSFGSFMLLPNPMDVLMGSKSQHILYNSASHAVVYNKRYMEWLSEHDCLLGHTDFETNRHVSKYTYKIPLAYQKIEKTENSQEGWGYVYPMMETLLFSPLRLAHQVQPGYDIIKRWADIVSILILIIFIFAVRHFFVKLNK